MWLHTLCKPHKNCSRARLFETINIRFSFSVGVAVRLTGMNTSNAGDVHVKYNGTWGTICSSGSALTFKSAQVVCRQLQLGPPVKHSFSHRECTSINEGAETVWLSDLNCQGYEESIDQCPHRGWGKLDPEMCEGCTAITCSVCLICQPVKVSASGKVSHGINEPFSFRFNHSLNLFSSIHTLPWFHQ